MALSERRRNRIYDSMRRVHGDEVAGDVMELLPPVGWADVATKRDLDALEDRMDLRFESADHRFEAFEARVGQRIEEQTVRFVKWTATIAALSLAAAQALRLLG
jgi:hypothetical protein